MKFFTDKFKDVRRSRRFTIAKLSEEVGVTRATIWNWENGRRKPNETMVRKLALVLDVRTDSFSDIMPENELSKELLQKPIQSILINTGPGEDIRRKKFSDLIRIVDYFNNSLEQSSVVINAILDSMYSMCYIKDNNLQYISANKSFIDNLGVNEGFVITGKKDEDFFIKTEAAKNTVLDSEVLRTGTPVIGQEYFIPNSKKKRIGLITKQPIFAENNSVLGVVCIIVDITKRRSEEERRILLENIMNNIRTGVCFYNPKKKKIIYSNKSHDTNFLDSALNEVSNNSVHNEDYKRLKRYISDNLFPPAFNFRIKSKNGDLKWLRIKHSRVDYRTEEYFSFFEEDISSSKMSEEINTIVGESLDDIDLALCVVDIETKKMLYTNNYREKLYGYPVSAFLGKNNDFWLDTCIHPDDRERLLGYENDFEYPEKRYYRIIQPGGDVRWIEAKSVKKTFTYNGRTCLAFFDLKSREL